MSDKIIENVDALKELNSRAQGEVSIRDALTELEVKNISKFLGISSLNCSLYICLVLTI